MICFDHLKRCSDSQCRSLIKAFEKVRWDLQTYTTLIIGTALGLIVYADYWSSGSRDELVGKKNYRPWAQPQTVAFSRSRVGQEESLAKPARFGNYRTMSPS